jgi:hypothetical protein
VTVRALDSEQLEEQRLSLVAVRRWAEAAAGRRSLGGTAPELSPFCRTQTSEDHIMSRLFFSIAVAGLLVGCAAAGPNDSAVRAQDDRIHSACAALGLNPSEAPFVHCVRSLQASAPAQPAPATPVPTALAPTTNGATPSRVAEQRACSTIGLDPATAQFAACVSNLDATLFNLSRVGMD